MSSLLTIIGAGLVVLVALTIIVWSIAQLQARHARRSPDLAWKPSGRIQKFEGYDKEMQERASEAAKTRAKYQRKAADGSRAHVSATIVDIETRRSQR